MDKILTPLAGIQDKASKNRVVYGVLLLMDHRLGLSAEEYVPFVRTFCGLEKYESDVSMVIVSTIEEVSGKVLRELSQDDVENYGLALAERVLGDLESCCTSDRSGVHSTGKTQEHRREPRSVEHVCAWLTLEGSTFQAGTLAEDISCGGASFSTLSWINPGERVQVQLLIGSEGIECTGVVKWVMKLSHAMTRFGIQFVDIGPDERQKIARYLSSRSQSDTWSAIPVLRAEKYLK